MITIEKLIKLKFLEVLLKMARKKMNLLEKTAIGTGVLGFVSALPYLNSEESAVDNPYILGLLAISAIGACSALYRNNKG